MGNTARKLDQYPEYRNEHRNAPKVRKNTKPPVQKKRPTSNPLSKLFFTLSVMGLFVVGLFILQGYANITTVQAELSKQEAIIEDLEKKMADLTVQVEGIKNSSRVEEAAMYTLGLTYPEENQTVKISVPQPAQVAAVTEGVEFAGRVKTVLQFFSGAF